MKYQLESIDTSKIALTPEHLRLADVLAKQHLPLSEAPRQTQLLLVQEVLKLLLALGYRLESSSGANSPVVEESDFKVLLQNLKASSDLNLATLLDLQREAVRLQPRTPEIYQALGNSILQLGEPLMAYDVLAEGLKQWPADLRLQQLLALALARSGATVAANTLLLRLVQAGHQDEETLGLLARTHKDLWLQATDPTIQSDHLRRAAECYEQAYQRSGSTWTGINAATLAIAMGRAEQAQAIASAVQQQCLQKFEAHTRTGSADYWLLATLGEAALILKDWSAAETFYGQAMEVGQGRFGDLSSSRRNAMLLAEHLEIDQSRLKQWFHIPKVVVFCGHMIDRPGRLQPRFPAHLEGAVQQAISDRLQQLDARLGYASAACGSDILFLEALRELKGELHIVLPYNREQFITDSVDVMPEGNWRERFESLMQSATEVITASGQKLQENDVVYEYSNRLLHGLAKMRASQLGTDLIPMAAWNRQPGDGPGGTASTVAFWQQWTDHVEVIDLAALLQQTPIALPIANLAPPIHAEEVPQAQMATTPSSPTILIERQIRALLFADVVQYSSLTEEQYLPFVEHFLGAVAALSDLPAYPPLLKNTWGDALFFVFPKVGQAGEFALELCDLVQSIDWSQRGLPQDLNLRIALHAGPVDRNRDPITGQYNYIGTHVNHTARIEPITPPGKVYASQAFAAIAASEGLQRFTCDYVGQMPWAKRYGTFPTYHVRRCL